MNLIQLCVLGGLILFAIGIAVACFLYEKKSEREALNIKKLPTDYKLVFIDEDSNRWEFKPQKTITTYETALLLPVFYYTPFPMNRFFYIRKHNLMKHFKKVEKEDEVVIQK